MGNKIFIMIIATVLSVYNVNAADWMTSFEAAKKMALATDKLILVDFWAIWCGPCLKMDSETWNQDEVKTLMDSYVPVKVDIDKNKDIALQYGVSGIPYIFIMDGNGKILYKQMSYKSRNEVIKLLKKYALTTAFLKQDLINYHSQQNFTTAFRLASKYQDYSLYLTDKEVKYDLLKLSSDYFKESEKLLKNSDLPNKEAFAQKIELLDIQKSLITQDTRKALKKLDKINGASIHDLNVSLYNFLYYTAYSMENDKERSSVWKDKLSEFDVRKSQLFLKNEVSP